MPRIVHKQKGLLGVTAYMDENYRVFGTSHKGLFGEEVLLDKDFRVIGYGWKGLGGKVYLDKDGRCAGWFRKGLGEHETVFLNGAGESVWKALVRERNIRQGAWIVCGIIVALIILVLYLVMR